MTTVVETHDMGKEPIASPPPGRPRVVVSLIIVLYLLWQVAVPISYYLGDDVSDERFSLAHVLSHRVFSSDVRRLSHGN